MNVGPQNGNCFMSSSGACNFEVAGRLLKILCTSVNECI